MRAKKKVIIITTILVILVSGFLIFGKSVQTGRATEGIPLPFVPLSQEEQQKVAQTILPSEFIKDVPKDDPIALIFFNFKNGQKVQQNVFLIGKNQFLSEGEPSIILTLHSKYIAEINENNLCETIKKAKQNGDLGFQSEYGKARLLLKYVGMLKHRECFGF